MSFQFELAKERLALEGPGSPSEEQLQLHCYAVQLYCREGWAIQPSLLREMLITRSRRARLRGTALKGLTDVATQCKCLVAVRHALIPLRSAFRLKTLTACRRELSGGTTSAEQLLRSDYHYAVVR